jgi:hypothetical protein
MRVSLSPLLSPTQLQAGEARPAVSAGLARRLWADRPLRTAVLAGLAAYAVLQVVFIIHVHVSFAGKYHGPFLMGRLLGVGEREDRAGIRPVTANAGWDAQFYYQVSNDLGIRRDNREHMDSASYRYQRAGVPILAHLLSKALGYKLTSPFLYHALQLFLAAVGFGALVYWLVDHGVWPGYALTWLLSCGTLATLRYGMPDPCCDAFFLVALLAAYYRRLGLYALAATWMCLGRETYVLFPFTLWVLTAADVYQWPSVKSYWARVTLAAVPGVVLLGWTAFVAWRLDLPLLHGARQAPWGALTDYPFWGAVKCFWDDWKANRVMEIEYKLVSFLSLVVVLFWAAVRGSRMQALAAAIPFLLLLTMTGKTIWEGFGGHAKNVTPALAVGVLLLPFCSSRVLRLVLVLNVFTGADLILRENVLFPPHWWSDRAAVMAPEWVPPQNVPAPRVTDYRSRVTAELVNTQDDPPYHGPWRWCHREPLRVRLRVQNLSAQTWPALPAQGRHTLAVGCIVRNDKGEFVRDLSYPLPHDVPPGGGFEMLFPFDYLRLNGSFTAEFGVIQYDDKWFFEADPTFGSKVSFENHWTPR